MYTVYTHLTIYGKRISYKIKVNEPETTKRTGFHLGCSVHKAYYILELIFWDNPSIPSILHKGKYIPPVSTESNIVSLLILETILLR